VTDTGNATEDVTLPFLGVSPLSWANEILHDLSESVSAQTVGRAYQFFNNLLATSGMRRQQRKN